MKKKLEKLVYAMCATGAASIVSSASASDFGEKVQQLANAMSVSLFGTVGALDASSTASLTADQANANPAGLATVAQGLKISVVSAHPALSPNIDQMVLWPDAAHPT